mmetsp:Transcript_59821/g.122759  ORF Transcript_59821/g.122759 Transcript_59821/m.122759 type:complete len:255 (+) Transcript_59821:795-1559(+)
MVVRQLQHRIEQRLHKLRRFWGGGVWGSDAGGEAGHEVVGEVSPSHLPHQRHAKLLVEGDGNFGVLDPEHRLGEVVLVFDLGVVRPFHQLHPVTVRVVHEREPLHASLVGLLLKGKACRLQFSTRCVHVVDVERHVPEAILLLVPRMISLEVGVALSAVVVRQLQRRPAHRPQELVSVDGTWGVLIFLSLRKRCEEIQVELHIRELELVNQRHPQRILVEGKALLGVLDSQHGLLPRELLRCEDAGCVGRHLDL